MPCDIPGVAARTPAFANEQSAPAGFSAAQIEKLVAPIALYPDAVLTDILAASTYPAQLVEAARFATSHPGLQAGALAEAAASHDWDASVLALLGFPSVLHMLDADLEWTDRLGRAFISQQGDVLAAIQHLRLLAERAGSLQNGPDAAVVNDGGAITIDAPSPQSIYLPAYDAGCVFGQAGCSEAAAAIGWGEAIFLPFGFTQWGALDWQRRCIRQNHGGGVWHGGTSRSSGVARREPDRLGGTGGIWAHEAPRGLGPKAGLPGVAQFHYAPAAGILRPGYGMAASPAGRSQSAFAPDTRGPRMGVGPIQPAATAGGAMVRGLGPSNAGGSHR